MQSYSFKLCASAVDRTEAVNLLDTVKEELRLPDRSTCQQVVDLCLDKGGILLGYDQLTPCVLGGFLHGDPSEGYADKSVGFLYVAAVLPEYRLTRAFYNALHYGLQVLKDMGAQKLRLQAEKGNRYTNKLYNRFAHPAGEGRTLRGLSVITYQNDIDEAQAYFSRRRPYTRPAAYSAVDTI